MTNEKGPFFLIGAERSGTTLLRLMMDHHPQIRFQFESNFLVDYLTPEGTEPDSDLVKEKLALNREARLCDFQLQGNRSYTEEVRAFLHDDAQNAGKPIYGAAIHRRFSAILKIWPRARFLNLLRDPRDVASSVIAMGWAGNPWHGSLLWLQAQQEAEALLNSVPPERCMRLRFEDLVTHPVATLTQICEFLGCSFDEAMLTYPEDTTYPAPDASAAGRWRNKLTSPEIQMVENCVGQQLQAAGYEPSGLPPRSFRGFLQLGLNLQNRFYKFRFGANRHGWGKTIAYTTSRRLGMKSLSNRLLLSMQERSNQFLR